MGVVIQQETPEQSEVLQLLHKADDRSSSLYPSESRHGPSLNALMAPNVRFFVARIAGIAVGCGGYAIYADGTAELKRVFVNAESRGQGVGRTILEAIEGSARRACITRMQLETGIKSVEAIRLYQRLGYRERGPFGTYVSDPLSVFMVKEISRRE